MDDSITNESGILALPSTEDIPVHSTPIKGAKIPLPSTRNVVHPRSSSRNRDNSVSDADRMKEQRQVEGFDSQTDSRKGLRDDLYKQHRKSGQLCVEGSDIVKQKHQHDIQEKDTKNWQIEDCPSTPPRTSYTSMSPGNIRLERRPQTRRTLIPRESSKYGAISQGDTPSSPQLLSHLAQNSQLNSSNSPVLSKGICSKFSKSGSESSSEQKHYSPHSSKNCHEMSNPRTTVPDAQSTDGDEITMKSSFENKTDENSNAFSRSHEVNKIFERQYHWNNQKNRSAKSSDSRDSLVLDSLDDTDRPVIQSGSFSGLRGSPARIPRKSAIKQQSKSYSVEMEETTVMKQRKEIQLLVVELKDRDRELTEMFGAQQQQLEAWEQDRQRLANMESRCLKLEDELKSKSAQLSSAVQHLRSIQTRYTSQISDFEEVREKLELMGKTKREQEQEMIELKERNQSVVCAIQDVSTSNGRLQAREEELITVIRLKEKDISLATGHMKDLSDRLTQLDRRCKECQDREKEALKQGDQWRTAFEATKHELHSVNGDARRKSSEVAELEMENCKLRRQIDAFHEHNVMREKDKDDLIDSMKTKVNRTDAQLKNVRELYDRQLREVSSLQIKLDTSKEIISKQQTSLEGQQSNNCSSLSLPSPDKSTTFASLRTQNNLSSRSKDMSSSPSRVKFPEADSDLIGSPHHTQSSGYQTQSSVNQSADFPTYQPMSDQPSPLKPSNGGEWGKSEVSTKLTNNSPRQITDFDTDDDQSEPERRIERSETNLHKNSTSDECKQEMDQKYMFENRLSSFLEELDDIDENIWDLQNTNESASSAGPESSPGSKLQKLLLESRMMIDSLEKSADIQTSRNSSNDVKSENNTSLQLSTARSPVQTKAVTTTAAISIISTSTTPATTATTSATSS